MARRRRAGDGFIGLVILAAIIVGALGWVRENVVDFTRIEFWVAIGTVVALIVVGKVARSAAVRKHAARLQAEHDRAVFLESARIAEERRRFKEWGIGRAVEIATHQQWVSPSRLSKQAQITEIQARDLLAIAAESELLYQAVNGRFYLQALLGSEGAPPAVGSA